jgi:hypothetical protein
MELELRYIHTVKVTDSIPARVDDFGCGRSHYWHDLFFVS